jgi:hypothetical protein
LLEHVDECLDELMRLIDAEVKSRRTAEDDIFSMISTTRGKGGK